MKNLRMITKSQVAEVRKVAIEAYRESGNRAAWARKEFSQGVLEVVATNENVHGIDCCVLKFNWLGKSYSEEGFMDAVFK